MALSKIRFNPGIDKEGTEYTADAGWYDGDKVRFRKGRPEKIGGWVKLTQNYFLGVCRSLFDWASLEFLRYIGVGTNLKFYVSEGNDYSDITPIRTTTAAGDVTFAATDGSSTITVTNTSHGAVLNDFVTFSGAVSLGGNIIADVLNQEYQITGVPTANTYTITAKDTNGDTVTANASDSGNGGGSVVGEYQINTGLNAYVAGTGWGARSWSASTWGSASALSSSGQLRLYSQDNFGEDLIFNVRAGGIYYWDESSGASTRAVALEDLAGASNAPTVALQIMVSDTDRHVIAFGCNPIGSSTIDPLFVRFSDQENAADWTPTATNTAGGVRINSGSIIIGALQTRQEILIWTDVSVHSMRFVGSPFVFEFNRITSDASMISPNAAVDVGGVVYFMDRGNFYIYNGSVQVIPCTVKDYVFSNLNEGQAFKVFAAENRAFSEVTWFYPVGTDNTEITNYVTYNYEEGSWTIGTLGRGAWVAGGTRQNPIASSVLDGENNYLYEHEVGHDADGEAMTAYIESGDIEIADGERLMFMNRIIPDLAFRGSEDGATIDYIIKGADYPLQTNTALSTSEVTPSTTQVYVRNRARQVVFRAESDGAGYGWRLGDLRVDIKPDGRR